MDEEELKSINDWKESNLANYLKKGNQISQDEIDHIFDWFKSDDCKKYRKRLYRISVKDAISLSEKWTEKMNKQFIKKNEINCDLDGVTIVRSFEDNYYFVKLEDFPSYQREGALMGHCVGNDATYFNNNSEIYSLRDSKNQPHCTIEIQKNKNFVDIRQIKGKGNKEVVEKYHHYVVDFLNSVNFDSINHHDLLKFNCVNIGNSLYLENKIPKEIEINKNFNLNINKKFNKIKVHGDCTFSNLNLDIIADEIIVYGDLFIKNCNQLLRLCNHLVVYGDVEIESCNSLRILAKESDYIIGNIVVEECELILKNKLSCHGIVEFLDEE